MLGRLKNNTKGSVAEVDYNTEKTRNEAQRDRQEPGDGGPCRL